MRLKEKLFPSLNKESSQDKIQYNRVAFEKTKAERKKSTIQRTGGKIEEFKHYSVLPPEINNSIETLPLWYWWEIQKTGNAILLDTKKSKNKLLKFKFYCYACWEDMQDQHITEFGIPKEFHEKTKAQSKVAQAKAKYAVSQDNWDLTLLNEAMRDPALKPKGKTVSNWKIKQAVEIATGCGRIDPRITTVIEYGHLTERMAQLGADGKG
jgi:hypothetical protein